MNEEGDFSKFALRKSP